jgi:hypothetical protein
MTIFSGADPKPEKYGKTELYYAKTELYKSINKIEIKNCEQHSEFEKRITQLEDDLFIKTTKKEFTPGMRVTDNLDASAIITNDFCYEAVGYSTIPYKEYHYDVCLRYFNVACRANGSDEIIYIREDNLKIV